MAALARMKQKVATILANANLDLLTERMVRDELSAEFGAEEVAKHSRAIKNTVEKCLEESLGGERLRGFT